MKCLPFATMNCSTFVRLVTGIVVLLSHATGAFRYSNQITRSLSGNCFDNGILELIIRAYVDTFLQEMQSIPTMQLSIRQEKFIRQRMKSLYDHIRLHPALHQRYLWVGREKPTMDPDISNSAPDHIIRKEKRGMFPSEEICRTDRQWEQLNRTHDFYENEVEVVQDDIQQYIFSYRCVNDGGSCIGISPLYESECTERYGWLYMYYRRTDVPEDSYQWGYVAAPHHCACKITPKLMLGN